MTVLPPISSHLLPKPFGQHLIDLKSELRNYQPDENGNGIDFCPCEYEVDAYGADFESQFIAILPFVTNEVINKVY